MWHLAAAIGAELPPQARGLRLDAAWGITRSRCGPGCYSRNSFALPCYTRQNYIIMALHPTTFRAIKRSAYYSTVISSIGLTFGLISILCFDLMFFDIAFVARIIAWLFLLPSTLIFGLVYDPFPNVSSEAADCLSATTSMVVYFGLICLAQLFYFRLRPTGETPRTT